MAIVNPGYRGLASLGSVGNIRFASADLAAKQEVRAEDLIMGDWDRDAWVYGPITVGGSMSGPVTETFTDGGGVFDWACNRELDCGELSEEDVTIYYYCDEATGGRARLFSGMQVNSMQFSVTAGDIANFTLDLKARTAGSGWTDQTPPHFTKAEKLITWDKVQVTVPGHTSVNYQSFEFTVNNNLTEAYSLSQADLYPVAIVPGLRHISGSLTTYNAPDGFDGALSWDDYLATDVVPVTFNIGGLAIVMNVVFHRIVPSSQVGLITSTVAFTGVTHQSGAPWGD
jgi:hypothetical protein